VIDKTKPILERPDGTKVVTLENGYPYHVIEGDPINDELDAYLAKHPEALIPEPQPPKPSAEELAAREAAQAQAEINELERKAIRPLLAIARGLGTKDDEARIAEIGALIDPLAEKVRTTYRVKA
jgi:hypothetical protein